MNHRPDRTGLLAVALCLLLAACAGDTGKPASGSPDPDAVATPAPAIRARPEPADTAKAEIDYSCAGDAQCTIKDIGSCCGYRPACVNVDSPTDPAGVKAACERDGTAGICGFPSISACQCVNSRCEGIAGPSPAATPVSK